MIKETWKINHDILQNKYDNERKELSDLMEALSHCMYGELAGAFGGSLFWWTKSAKAHKETCSNLRRNRREILDNIFQLKKRHKDTQTQLEEYQEKILGVGI